MGKPNAEGEVCKMSSIDMKTKKKKLPIENRRIGLYYAS